MKTSHFIRTSLVVLSLSLIFVACKKDNVSSPGSTPATADLQTSTDDQTMASNENDAVTNDVNTSIESSSSYARVFADANASTADMRVDGIFPICDANLTLDTTGATKTIIIIVGKLNQSCWINQNGTHLLMHSVVLVKPMDILLFFKHDDFFDDTCIDVLTFSSDFPIRNFFQDLLFTYFLQQ